MAPQPAPASLDAGAVAAAAATVRVGEPRFVDGTLHWVESSPRSDGASWLLAEPDGARVSPDGCSVRTSLYGYGASAWCPTPLGPLICDAATGSLLVDGRALDAPELRGARLGDPCAVPGTSIAVVVVASLHPKLSARLCAVDLGTGTTAWLSGDAATLLGEPCASPDGRRLAWTQWPRGSMPWDAAQVVVAELDVPARTLRRARRVDGGTGGSAGLPTWRPDGSLAWVGEAAGYWQPWVVDDGGVVRRLCGRHGEFQRPRWLTCRWLAALGGDGHLACAFADDLGEHVGVLAPDGTLTELDQPCVRIDGLDADDERVGWVGASSGAQGVVGLKGPGTAARTLKRGAAPTALQPHRVSLRAGSTELCGVVWPPLDAPSPAPLVVSIHPGPTGATDQSFAAVTQLLCAEGFVVASFDTSGSTAHGRAHRDRLRGRWLDLDLDELDAAVAHLVDRGVVRGDAVFARGTSAGGTAALALRARGRLCGAVAWYPASRLVDDEAGFEAGYLGALLAGRQPPLAVGGRGAVLVVQGRDDEVVPLRETEELVAGLRAAGAVVELCVLDGEGHGLRTAAARAAALDAELRFYRRCLRELGGAARYDAESPAPRNAT